MDQPFALEAGRALLQHLWVAVQAQVEGVRSVDLQIASQSVDSSDARKVRRTSGTGAWRVPRGGSNSVSSSRRKSGFSTASPGCACRGASSVAISDPGG